MNGAVTATVAEVARRYFDLGLAVVPLEQGSKVPSWKRWTEPRDPAEVFAYFETHPSANLGILLGEPSGGVVCVDLDDRHAAAELARRHPEVRELPTVRTGRGVHLYLRPVHPEAWPNAKIRLEGETEPCGELLGSGRQAVAPPSHVQGEPGPRKWHGGWPTLIPEVDLEPGDLGLTLVRHLTTGNGYETRLEVRGPRRDTLLERALEQAHPGNRHEACLWLSIQLRDCGYSEREGEAVVYDFAQRVPPGDHPFTVNEAMATVRSVYRTPAREPWPEPRRVSREQAREQVETAVAAGVTTDPRRIKVLLFRELADLVAQKVSWIVPGWVAAGHVTLLAGPRECLKSCLALDMFRAVATGGDFAGERCEQAVGLYFDAENGGCIIWDRLKAFGLPEEARLYVNPLQPLNLCDKPTADEALAVVRDTGARFVCLDSVRRFHMGDENGSEWTQRLYSQFLVPLREAGCGVLLLHNAGRPRLVPQPGELYRGSSDLGAAVDIYAEAQLIERNTARYTFEKYRFGTPPKPVVARLRTDGGSLTLTLTEDAEDAHGGPDTELVAKTVEALTETTRLSRSQLAVRIGCSKDALRPVLAALEAKGVITHTNGGGNVGFLYERTARPQGDKRESEVLNFESENEGDPFNIQQKPCVRVCGPLRATHAHTRKPQVQPPAERNVSYTIGGDAQNGRNGSSGH